MATTYYTRVHIEGIWTKYQVNKDQDIERSKGGHMWYEIYLKDENGNITNQLSSGYTSHGVVNNVYSTIRFILMYSDAFGSSM